MDMSLMLLCIPVEYNCEPCIHLAETIEWVRVVKIENSDVGDEHVIYTFRMKGCNAYYSDIIIHILFAYYNDIIIQVCPIFGDIIIHVLILQ